MSRRAIRLLLLALAAIFAAAPLFVWDYGLTLMDYIGMSALVALGLVLLTGVGGMTSFGQAAFVGIGAYATAWLTTKTGASPWLGLVLALVLAGAAATILGLATLRLSGHFLPVSTIAWGIAIYYLFGEMDALGRYNGISHIPAVTLGPWTSIGSAASYYLIWIPLGLAMLVCANLLDSRQGRAIRSLRGGSAMAESLGIHTFRIRLKIFVLAAMLAALSGWQYAHIQRYIAPAAFDVQPGLEYLLMAILGGAGHISGALVGAALVTLFKDVLQDILPYLARNSAQLEIVVFGALLILILQQARDGVVVLVLRFLPRPAAPPITEAAPLPRRSPPAPGGPLLVVEGATRRFGGLVAVNDVAFSVRSGEILGLIGPNGAGKSTMFNLITGVLKLNTGRIRFAGTDITGIPARRIAALGVARTFQHVKLRPTMTVLENTMLGAYLRTRAGMLLAALRLDRGEERALRGEAMHQLRRVGLAGKANELAGNLPLGEQRILEVARALAADPVLIILDEPAAGLPRAEKMSLAALLRELRVEGMSILLVEHDMDFVMGLVDRVVVMDFGAKLAEGLPAEIRADPRVQEAYLGDVA